MLRPFLALALLCGHAFAVGEGYTNFVRQNQQTSGVVWDMPVVPTGTGTSLAALEDKGAVFQLWTVQTSPLTQYLLDTKLVSAYMPTAVITIVTEDPYTTVARTRADRPFTVNINVAGLITTGITATTPDASKRVLLQQYVAPYPTGVTSLVPSVVSSGTPFMQAYITTNGTTTLKFAKTSIKATDPTQATGEEHFLVQALADASIAQTQIARNFVQIWPVASATLAGISSGDKIRSSAPTVKVTFTNLYPRSDSWVQVYPGNPVLGTTGTTIPGSYLVLDQAKGDTRTLTLTGYEAVFPTDGVYTMEALTKTPFGTDRLTYVTFTVARTLSVRSQIGESVQ
jgi:hypothetical protein